MLAGTDFDLSIGEPPVNFTGRRASRVAVNGSLPAPTLRWREGSTVDLRVEQPLAAASIHGRTTSIHWHGILLPANMDGVPGMSFDGIGRGETYRYRFELKQSGTYWYHSHSGFQEQAGLYGADDHRCRRARAVRLRARLCGAASDWTDLEPADLFARLKKMPRHDNYSKRTVGDFLRDAKDNGLDATIEDRGCGAAMRMTPTDLSDVNANTYTYLINGTTCAGQLDRPVRATAKKSGCVSSTARR